MNDKPGNVVIAGDAIYASIGDDDPLSECVHAMVIEFNNPEELGNALKSGKAEFTVFGVSNPRGE